MTYVKGARPNQRFFAEEDGSAIWIINVRSKRGECAVSIDKCKLVRSMIIATYGNAAVDPIRWQ